MNKKQLIVMWVGIGIIVLMGLFPPQSMIAFDIKMPHSFCFVAKATNLDIEFTRLLTQWIVTLALTTGFIITFNDRKDK